MLLTASKTYVRHPELSAAKANRDYVLNKVGEAVASISEVAQGRCQPSCGGEAGGEEGGKGAGGERGRGAGEQGGRRAARGGGRRGGGGIGDLERDGVINA